MSITDTSSPVAGTASRRATLVVTATAVAMPVLSVATVGIRGLDRDPWVETALIIAAIGAVALVAMTALVPWALRGGPRRAHAVAWTALAVGVVVSPFFFWTMLPVIAGGVAATIGWVRRGEGRQDEALAWLGSALIVLDVCAYVASM
ncbi:hypothetical protein [Demequina maris]|uniref:hypothetical protein n=1 Tax=Demequina maris TaxID=1638982 RepID=UPI0007841094|nr:hypothetical protein [Demequina maris]